ncbi:hypothetical protein CJF32_00009514 [Rutstroemia sp. NJR-2017a WRK4]|nr:hypothetical protein CJF32_00009514 [Rutstroemia sp. NJR-2017a WRK4]
MVLKRPLNTYF